MSIDPHKEEINSIKGEMQSLNGKLDKVLTILGGDDIGYSTGLVDDMKTLKKDVTELTDFKKRLVWIAASLVLVFQLGYTYVKDFFLKGDS